MCQNARERVGLGLQMPGSVDGREERESRSKHRIRKNETTDQKDAKITLDIFQSQDIVGDSS